MGNSLSLGKTGLSARCGHIWDEQIQRAAMAPLPDAYVMTVWRQSDSLALAGGSSQGTDVNAAVGCPARGPLNGLPLRAAPGGARELRAGVPGHTGAHTSVHHTSGMHVLHSAAQLHEVLPHGPLRNKPLLLLEVLWGDRQTDRPGSAYFQQG